jgi:hypothetical protein
VQRINGQVVKRLIGTLLKSGDHGGTLTQGLFFLPGVAAVDDVARSSAVCAGDFIREGGVRGTELAGDPDAVYEGGWN